MEKEPKYTDVEDPFFVSDNPQIANRMALAGMARNESERRKHIKNANEETELDYKKQEALEKKNEELDEDDWRIGEALDDWQPEQPEYEDNENLEVEYREEDPLTSEVAEQAIGNTEALRLQRDKLTRVYKEAEEYRRGLKWPGNRRPRLMSVAAAELKKVEQPDNPDERVAKNNAAIEEAARLAVGNKQTDKYFGDAVANVQLYISEMLIGKDADLVSIGTTETIVNSNGQIGKEPDIYKNMVVLRWVKSEVNHVFAFSPKEDSAMYMLVDDSIGNSWREKFIEAGAADGKRRKEIMMLNHVQHDGEGIDFYHEKSMERLVKKVLDKDWDAIFESDMLTLEEKANKLESTSKIYEQLAHFIDKKRESEEDRQ